MSTLAEQAEKAKARLAELGLLADAHRHGLAAIEREAAGLREFITLAAGATCRHCQRHIEQVGGVWIDPGAPATPEDGDDFIWRETCDANETFTAEHEPA